MKLKKAGKDLIDGIDGVEFKELVTHRDSRGFFRELIRASDPFFGEGFGQWNHSVMYDQVAKGWHIHQQQVDFWYISVGVIKALLYDAREKSPTFRRLNQFLMGEDQPVGILRIPPGVAHGCKVLLPPVHMHYVVSREYDPADEGRIPHDDPAIGYDWLAGPAIT